MKDPFTDLRMDIATMNAEQLRKDMRLMYRMIEGTRDYCCNKKDKEKQGENDVSLKEGEPNDGEEKWR